MNIEKAQNYLYEQLLKSFKEKSWEMISSNDNIEVEDGETRRAENLIKVSNRSYRLYNKEINIFFNSDLDQDSMKHIIEKNPNYFKFNPEKRSDFEYWFKLSEGEEDRWNHGYSTSYIYIKLNWWQRRKMNKYFYAMIKEFYETKYQKTFNHSMDRYMKRHKSIFRDQRLNELLNDKTEKQD